MKFDFIIGNPPYNNNLFNEFIAMAQKCIKEDGYQSMVLPAKWVNASMSKDLSSWMNKYLEKVVYFRHETDIFNITEPDGIMYYLASRKPRQTCWVKGVSKHNKKYFDFDWVEYDSTEDFWLYNPMLVSILQKCKKLCKTNGSLKDVAKSVGYARGSAIYVANQNLLHDSKQADDDVRVEMSASKPEMAKWISRKDLLSTYMMDKFRIFTSTMSALHHTTINFVIGICSAGDVFFGSFVTFIVFDTRVEAEHCQAFFQSKFWQMNTMLAQVSSTMTTDMFRYVPALDFTKAYVCDNVTTSNDRVVNIKDILGLTSEEVDYINQFEYLQN
jgi:hypothetical protein